jgi:hypothetical protein
VEHEVSDARGLAQNVVSARNTGPTAVEPEKLEPKEPFTHHSGMTSLR